MPQHFLFPLLFKFFSGKVQSSLLTPFFHFFSPSLKGKWMRGSAKAAKCNCLQNLLIPTAVGDAWFLGSHVHMDLLNTRKSYVCSWRALRRGWPTCPAQGEQDKPDHRSLCSGVSSPWSQHLPVQVKEASREVLQVNSCYLLRCLNHAFSLNLFFL